MRADPEAGWLELLYKVVGEGTRLLARQAPGTTLSALGPIGTPFDTTGISRALLLGGGVGMPPMIFLAERLRAAPGVEPLVVLGSEVPFPFETGASRVDVPGIPDTERACMPLLESWGVASRLASLQGYPGCHRGFVTDVARAWLEALGPHGREGVAVLACGPTPMLRAAAALAGEYALPIQVCLEEYMACAVGGCAGCAVRVRTPAGPAMRRVCVDGPVFDGSTIVWEAVPRARAERGASR